MVCLPLVAELLPGDLERGRAILRSQLERIKLWPNFEKVLGEMIGLAHWMTPSPLGNALRQLIAPNGAPIGMIFQEGRYAATVSVTDQLTHLLVQLAKHMREKCKGGAIARQGSFMDYKAVFDRLRDRFEIGVLN